MKLLGLGKCLGWVLFMWLCQACQSDRQTSPDILVDTHDNSDNFGLFELVSADVSGLDFENTLEEGINTNILLYEYFYNGGGVGVGDFNDDGLEDIYFVSNMGENQLYLNKGKLNFQKVTAQSGAAGRLGPWKTGISVADINGDGLLDMYLCYSGAMPTEKRKNQLFINTGNDDNDIPQFVDQAEQYGIASSAFSNQAYFFDYDRDGDLDMLLLNHNPKNLPLLNELSTAQMLKKDDPLQGVRLYEQDKDNKRFIDVTTSAGISSSALTYGLGLGISDLNEDGWPDFYISNDYSVPDYLYINQKNGKFKNELASSLGHISQFSMGNDIADINNDGHADIVTLDMRPEDNKRQKLLMAPDDYNKFDLNVRSGFYFQFMRNMLHLNNANGTFSEIGQYAGISSTDWSWSALVADYDNDGWKDIYITNGYKRDYTNLDFINYMNDYTQQKGRLKREDVLEIINNMPSSDVVNYAYRGQADLKFNNVTKLWGVNHVANSNGAAYADFDNDGDLDLVVNNINQKAFLYKNKSEASEKKNSFLQIKLIGEGSNTRGVDARVDVFIDGMRLMLEQQPSRGYLSSVTSDLHFGMGDYQSVDSLKIRWSSGKIQTLKNVPTNGRITLHESDAAYLTNKTEVNEPIFKSIPTPINYSHPQQPSRDFNLQLLLHHELSNQGPVLAKADINNDGLEDLFIGGARDQSAQLYLQNSNGSFSNIHNEAFIQDKGNQDGAAVFFDADLDGHLDLYVSTSDYSLEERDVAQIYDRLYFGDGSGKFKKSNDHMLNVNGNNETIAVGDMNGDGFLDLFVGGRTLSRRYPESPYSYILINDGRGYFNDMTSTIAPNISTIGMVTDAKWVDFNNDAQLDLVVVGEWMGVSVFINENGKLIDKTSSYFSKSNTGWWNTVVVEDFNKDDKVDLLVGNFGTNSLIQVADNRSVQLFYKDFDNNGSVDPILSYYNEGLSYPFATRGDLLSQLPGFRPIFKDYLSYAQTTTAGLLNYALLQDPSELAVTNLKTTLWLSSENQSYRETKLPDQVQYSPVYNILVLDYNKDGYQDVLLTGNNRRMSLRMGSCDANYGMLLENDGKGNFKYIEQKLSGLNIKGDVRSSLRIDDKIFFGINQGQLQVYKIGDQ